MVTAPHGGAATNIAGVHASDSSDHIVIHRYSEGEKWPQYLLGLLGGMIIAGLFYEEGASPRTFAFAMSVSLPFIAIMGLSFTAEILSGRQKISLVTKWMGLQILRRDIGFSNIAVIESGEKRAGRPRRTKHFIRLRTLSGRGCILCVRSSLSSRQSELNRPRRDIDRIKTYIEHCVGLTN